MRALTFQGFLIRYLKSLSSRNSSSFRALATEAISESPRLREPLAVLSVITGASPRLMKLWAGTRPGELFSPFLMCYDQDSLLAALKDPDSTISPEVRKVWVSYTTERDKHLHDAELKKLLCARVSQLQAQSSLSTYRACKDLSLNNSNVCTWIRTGQPQYVTLADAKRLYEYFNASSLL